MGGGGGYEIEYRFWVDDDIIHRYSRFNIRDDIRFLFEFRTNFRVKEEDCGRDEIIDTERFEIGAEDCDPYTLNSLLDLRLEDYWFRDEEIWKFAEEASAFAAAAASKRRRAIPVAEEMDVCTVRVIPIAVEMDICTVRKSGESLSDAKDRAIRPERMFPLSLMTNRHAFVNVDESPYHALVIFLRGPELCPPMRIGWPQGFGSIMEECYICQRRLRTGDQLAILKNFCGHTFHYHCFIRAMLSDTTCPRCSCSLSSAIGNPIKFVFKSYCI